MLDNEFCKFIKSHPAKQGRLNTRGSGSNQKSSMDEGGRVKDDGLGSKMAVMNLTGVDQTVGVDWALCVLSRAPRDPAPTSLSTGWSGAGRRSPWRSSTRAWPRSASSRSWRPPHRTAVDYRWPRCTRLTHAVIYPLHSHTRCYMWTYTPLTHTVVCKLTIHSHTQCYMLHFTHTQNVQGKKRILQVLDPNRFSTSNKAQITSCSIFFSLILCIYATKKVGGYNYTKLRRIIIMK